MATNTKNYNFKKPDESDFYDIQDQNGNWDIVDEKMEELSAPTFEDYSSTTSVPEASTAIEAIKSKKKIPEILANIKAAFKGVCLLGHIVNNCVTDNAKLPLSAAQGKALMDQITKLNSDLANAIASKPCNLSGGTVEFIIDISNLQIKRFALHVTCSGSIWAEFMLLIISYSDLSASLEEAGITKVKLYSTYDSKMIFKACTVQGSNGKIRIQAQNNYGEACMVSIISPYK